MRSKMSAIGTSDSAFHDGNPSTGELGTIVTADWLNAIQASTMDLQDELLSLLAAVSIANDPAVKTQILTAIKKLLQSGSATFATDTGAVNAYVVSLTPALTASRGEGMVIRFKVANTNTGACTVNDGVSTVPIVGLALSALQGGEMTAGGDAWIQWHPYVGAGSYVLLFCSGGALQIPPGIKSSQALNVSQFTGEVSCFAMTTAPTGWLKANGAAVSRTIYANLFAAIGTTFGGGNGSTTFNLPDLRGQFLRGYDDGKGVDSGRTFGSSQTDAIRNITGSVTTDNGWMFNVFTGALKSVGPTIATTKNATMTGPISTYAAFQFDASGSVPTAAENRPVNVALLACIKY